MEHHRDSLGHHRDSLGQWNCPVTSCPGVYTYIIIISFLPDLKPFSPNLMQIYTTRKKLMSTFTQRAYSAEKGKEDASKQKHNEKGKHGAVCVSGGGWGGGSGMRAEEVSTW